MRGAITPFLHISSWRVQGNFTLYFTKLKPSHNSDSPFRLPAQICDQCLQSTLSGMTCSHKILLCCRVKAFFLFFITSMPRRRTETWTYSSQFLNLCPSCNRVVTFTFCSLKPRLQMGFGETWSR